MSHMKIKQDVYMFITLLQNWNSKRFFVNSELTNVDLKIYTDSSSSFGFGGYNMESREYFFAEWKDHPIPVSDMGHVLARVVSNYPCSGLKPGGLNLSSLCRIIRAQWLFYKRVEANVAT